MSDRAIALANIEAIAVRAAALNALPSRGDSSGYGRKLHNIRQGRLGLAIRDEALAIVRRTVGRAPERAAVLAHLEACIEQSVRRHTEQRQQRVGSMKRKHDRAIGRGGGASNVDDDDEHYDGARRPAG